MTHEHAQLLLRLQRVTAKLTEACMEKQYTEAATLTDELEEIQVKLSVSIKHHIEWETKQ